MKRLILVLLMAVFAASTVQAAWDINFNTVQPPTTLVRLLRDRIGTLDSQILDLQSAGVGKGTGNYYYVDSGAGSDTYTGLTLVQAKATVEAAIQLCTADNGDVIFVVQGHAESGAAPGLFDADIAGVTIIGLGEGTLMPTFTFADTDTTIAVGAANVTFVNLRFLAGISEVVAGVIVEAAGTNFTMYKCIFPEPLDSSYEFDIGIQLTTAANDATIAHCTAYSAAATGATHWLNGGAGVVEGLTVVGNVVYGEYSIAPIFSDQADLKTHIADNIVGNMATGQKGIEFSGNATGWCYGNLVITDTVAESYDTGVMDGGGGLWGDEDSSDTTPVPWTTNETGVNRWGVTELAQIEGEVVDALETTNLSGVNPDSAWGKVYWVDADTGSDSDSGLTPDLAFATVAAAITANNIAFAADSDPTNTMYIHSKTYTENLTAFPKNCNVYGIGGKVRIQGYHNAGAAQNSRWHNVQFRSAQASTPIITVPNSSHGIEFHECVFDSSAAISECLLFTGSNSDIVIEKCRIGYETNPANSPDIAIRFGGVHAQRGKVVDNQIYSTGIGIQIDATMSSNNFLLIKDNVIACGLGSADDQMAIGINNLEVSPKGGMYVHNYISAVDAIYFAAPNTKSQWACIGNWVNEGATPAWEDGGTID